LPTGTFEISLLSQGHVVQSGSIGSREPTEKNVSRMGRE
jgi:hypothetical protein